jgi:hypothetical protein
LVFSYDPSVMRNLPSGFAYRRRAACRVQPADENPDARGLYLVVERVDIAGHRFVRYGRVVVVGMVNGLL